MNHSVGTAPIAFSAEQLCKRQTGHRGAWQRTLHKTMASVQIECPNPNWDVHFQHSLLLGQFVKDFKPRNLGLSYAELSDWFILVHACDVYADVRAKGRYQWNTIVKLVPDLVAASSRSASLRLQDSQPIVFTIARRIVSYTPTSNPTRQRLFSIWTRLTRIWFNVEHIQRHL